MRNIMQLVAGAHEDITSARKMLHQSPEIYADELIKLNDINMVARVLRSFSELNLYIEAYILILLCIYRAEDKNFSASCKDLMDDKIEEEELGKTYLHYAAEFGHHKLVKILLQDRSFEYVHMKDYFSSTALFYAVNNGHTDVVKELLDSCSAKLTSILIRDAEREKGRTILHWAAQLGHTEIIRLILHKLGDAAVEMIKKTDRSLVTPLFYAAREGHVDVMQCILEKIDEKSDDKEIIISQVHGVQQQTLLHHAVRKKQLAVVQFLIANVRDNNINFINMIDKQRMTALHYACRLGFEEAVPILLNVLGERAIESINMQNRAGRNVLHNAIKGKNIAIIKQLLDSLGVAAPNSIIMLDVNNNTVLHFSVETKTADITRLLLDRIPGDLTRFFSIQGQQSNTILHNAVINNDPEMVKLLLDYGAIISINIENQYGDTSLHDAADLGYTEVVRYLVRFLPDPDDDPSVINAQDSHGHTALHYAVRQGHVDIVRILLRHNYIDPNLYDNQDESPLLISLINNDKECREVLANHPRVNIDELDDNNVSPLMKVAAMNHTNQVAYLLIDQAADPSIEDANGHTVLQRAVLYKQYFIAKMILAFGNLVVFENPDLNQALSLIAQGAEITEIASCIDNFMEAEVKDDEFPHHLTQVSTCFAMNILHWAVSLGHYPAAKYISEKMRADINEVDVFDQTVLHHAVYSGQVEMVGFFLNNDKFSAYDNEEKHSGKTAAWSSLELEYIDKDIVTLFAESKEVIFSAREHCESAIMQVISTAGNQTRQSFSEQQLGVTSKRILLRLAAIFNSQLAIDFISDDKIENKEIINDYRILLCRGAVDLVPFFDQYEIPDLFLEKNVVTLLNKAAQCLLSARLECWYEHKSESSYQLIIPWLKSLSEIFKHNIVETYKLNEASGGEDVASRKIHDLLETILGVIDLMPNIIKPMARDYLFNSVVDHFKNYLFSDDYHGLIEHIILIIMHYSLSPLLALKRNRNRPVPDEAIDKAVHNDPHSALPLIEEVDDDEDNVAEVSVSDVIDSEAERSVEQELVM